MPDKDKDSDNYKIWISQKDYFSFIENSANNEFVPVCFYNSYGEKNISHELMYSFFLKKKGDGCNLEEIYKQTPKNGLPEYISSYGYGGGNDKYRIFKEETDFEPIIFNRFFDGRTETEGRKYFQLNQNIEHILDLHYIPHLQSYCHFNNQGKIEEIIKIKPKYSKDSYKQYVVLFRKDYLEFYMYLSNSVLLRYFNSDKFGFDPSKFDKWNNLTREKYKKDNFYYELNKEVNQSYLSGIHIIKTFKTNDEIELFTRLSSFEERKYATFITNDWKNKKIHECSCNPKELCSYFNGKESKKPFEISPVFFNGEVLNKYKNDFMLYFLEERSIHCDNGWYLQTYDYNRETKQVHTYLKYLARLPYSEQLHWKQFNERPKGKISERAFTNDFMGDFYDDDSYLSQLKKNLSSLKKLYPKVWNVSEGEYQNLVLNTNDSCEEWIKDIGGIQNIIFNKMKPKEFRNICEKSNLSCTRKRDGKCCCGVISTIKKIVASQCSNEETKKNFVKILGEINDIRIAGVGHPSKKKIRSLLEIVKSEHRDTMAHRDFIIRTLNELIPFLIQILKDNDKKI